GFDIAMTSFFNFMDRIADGFRSELDPILSRPAALDRRKGLADFGETAGRLLLGNGRNPRHRRPSVQDILTTSRRKPVEVASSITFAACACYCTACVCG